jgi:hypothetical protein
MLRTNNTRRRTMTRDEGESLEFQRNSPAWHAAWSGLAQEIVRRGWGDGTDLVQTFIDESWQSMGAYRKDGQLVCEFRHRTHPVTERREYVDVVIDEALSRYAEEPEEELWF